MKIYVDLVLLLNFSFDFILLLTVSVLLKRYAKLYRLLLGAFIGSLTTALLFFSITTLSLFIIKVIISILMIILTFNFRNLKYFFKNIIYLYTSSILLGGFLYFLNIQFSYKNKGLIFFNKGISVNFIFLVIISPVILYIYIKQNRFLKNNYSNYYKVSIYLKNQKINCNGYLDTGNKLVDPYFRRSIILINEEIIRSPVDFNILVPYHTIDNNGIIKCMVPERVEIEGNVFNGLIGIVNKKIRIDGVDCILPNTIMERKC